MKKYKNKYMKGYTWSKEEHKAIQDIIDMRNDICELQEHIKTTEEEILMIRQTIKDKKNELIEGGRTEKAIKQKLAIFAMIEKYSGKDDE